MKVSIRKIKLACGILWFFALASYSQNACSSVSENNDIFDLPIENLLDLEVTSVSKKAEKVQDASAAIYVITQEDIRRSGLKSIPEILRMAPGVQVAQIDSNKWAISARGFNRQFSNKLLVLIDGRSVYTPSFSGVYWDEQDTTIEDIERIEIIRGPGATLWGANAVNGVINIITKNAKNTQSNLASTWYGNHDYGTGTFRHGGKSKDWYYRTYVKHSNFGDYTTITGANANDNWRSSRGGFRLDSQKNGQDNNFTLQSDLYSGLKDLNYSLPSLTAAGAKTNVSLRERFEGANILGRWNKKISGDSETSLQMYYDYIQRIYTDLQVQDQKRSTVDVDFQHIWSANKYNEIVWGSGFRFISDDIGESPQVSYFSEDRQDSIYNAFIQDKITLIENKLFLTIGSKFEHNDYTGYEYQPSVRTSWLINDKQTLWGAISRAVRTPSRNEADIILANATVASPVGSCPASPSPGTCFASQVGTRAINSEDMTAYEIGYKIEPSKRTAFELATFFNDYTDLRTTDASLTNGILVDPTFGNNIVRLPLRNQGFAESYGLEANGTWDVTNNWKLASAYTFLSLNMHVEPGSGDTSLERDEGRSAKNIYNLRSMVDLPHDLEWDSAIYYVDNLSIGIDSYIRFDTRIGWKPAENLELSLAGQNLFDDWHQEFDETIYAVPSQIGRSFYLKATCNF